MLHFLILASTYGSGTYASGTYNGVLVAIGPVTLPDTGAGWSVLIGAALLSVGGGVVSFLWLRHRAVRQAS